MTPKQISYFTILSLFWGGSFLAIHYVVAGLPSAFGAFLRVFVALVTVGAMMLVRKNPAVQKGVRLQAFGAGTLNLGLPWLLLFYGEKFISPALSSILNSTTTIFIALFTPLFLSHSNLSRKNVIGIIVGFAGILAVMGPGVSSADAGQVRAELALIGMAISYALGTIWIKRVSHKIDKLRIIFYQALGGLAFLGIYNLLFEAPWRIDFMSVPFVSYASVIYLGTCSTVLSWIIYISLIRERGAAQASAALYVMPLISIALDFIVLHKTINLSSFMGAVVILAGVCLIQARQKRAAAGIYSEETV